MTKEELQNGIRDLTSKIQEILTDWIVESECSGNDEKFIENGVLKLFVIAILHNRVGSFESKLILLRSFYLEATEKLAYLEREKVENG